MRPVFRKIMRPNKNLPQNADSDFLHFALVRNRTEAGAVSFLCAAEKFKQDRIGEIRSCFVFADLRLLKTLS
jgi:hypothetical protein